MSTLVKASVGLGAISGIGGVSYGIYSTMQPTPDKPKTYAQEFDGTLLSTNNNENQDKWTARLETLKSAQDNTLIASLKAIKDKKAPATLATWQDVRNWCKDIINEENKGKEKQEFKNIESYCTFNIKDKITKAIAEGTDDNNQAWADAHEALKKIEDSELDDILRNNKAKKKVDTEVKKAIKGWCATAYTKPFKGDGNQEFKNASKVCVTK